MYTKFVSRWISIVVILVIITSCKSDKKKDQSPDIQIKVEPRTENIQVITNVMDFQVRDTIKSGWNTFTYQNKSNEAHFILFDKYPEGRTIEDGKRDVFPVFDLGMKLIIDGKMDEAMVAFGELPEWFSQIVFSGGSGLISPAMNNTFSLKLEPGYYVMECYVKMANGVFHSSMGMTKELIVIDESSGIIPPKSTIEVKISSTEGIRIGGEFSKGRNVIKVNYEDQIVHENFVGHDVNLVKIDPDAKMEELETWMNWAFPDGLMTPSPDGFTFLGGTNDSPAGSTQYFEVDLVPGKYALISEVPNASEKGLLVEFSITE